MPITQISSDSKGAVYFLTPTIWNWYYIFDRHQRWKILADSLKYFQEHRALEIYAYVFMLNHLHLIIKSPDAIAFIRDFKRHTSVKLRENILKTEPNILPLFMHENRYQLWKDDNKPKILDTDKFFAQKMNYIHNNPVVKGYVERPEYWKWSSANPGSEIRINRW